MGAVKLKENVYWVGVKNPELRVFDIIMETKKGTTYNSYLIDDEKVAIIDCVKDGYFDEFVENIKSIIGERKIDYIVVQHTELDHSGSLKKLLQVYPEAVVVASKAAINYSKEIVNDDFNSQPAVGNLNLGKYNLKFISAPNLHWPDTIFTYMEENNLLFTCDVFGSHYCPEKSVTDEYAGDYYDEMKYYFDCIMGPFKKFVNMATERIKDINIDMIAPSHGPIHINDIDKCFQLYKEWSYIKGIEEKNIQIFYISAYGNTEKMAHYFADKLKNEGYKAEAHEITEMCMNELVELVEGAAGIMVGSPTINQDAVEPAWKLLSSISAITNRGKAAAAFGSYGWSGEGVPMMTERLKSLKFKVIESGFRFKFVPDNKEFKEADGFIEKFKEII